MDPHNPEIIEDSIAWVKVGLVGSCDEQVTRWEWLIYMLDDKQIEQLAIRVYHWSDTPLYFVLWKSTSYCTFFLWQNLALIKGTASKLYMASIPRMHSPDEPEQQEL